MSQMAPIGHKGNSMFLAYGVKTQVNYPIYWKMVQMIKLIQAQGTKAWWPEMHDKKMNEKS